MLAYFAQKFEPLERLYREMRGIWDKKINHSLRNRECVTSCGYKS